jgi:hypothetical protein
MGVVLFEPFEFAKHGFNDLAAAEQAFLGRGLAGFRLPAGGDGLRFL